MPPEHVDFVVRFADGYVRLAKLASVAIEQNPTIDTRGLLSRDEIRTFLDGMLGTESRRALHVVAVLTSVGWTEDRQGEGEAIAQHFGLDWNTVRAEVEEFHRKYGITPRGGRYRYISPTPLGIHLAVEAWTTFPDRLKSLPEVLPSEGAREAYYERLQSIASNPQARKFARSELTFFFSFDDFIDARSVRRWSALSSADPDQAARNIVTALSNASIEDRKRIKDAARREAVWALVRLAWKPSSFYDAVKALAFLAEAENETWANNASAEFVARFQIFLGGTAVPYLDRLAVLDQLLAEDRLALASLTVQALSRAGNQQAFRMGNSPATDQLPEIEWQPRTGKEHFECVEMAIKRLGEIARRRLPQLQADLVAAAKEFAMMLRETSTRGLVVNLFDAVRQAYPEAREPLRRTIADIVYSEKNYWKEVAPDDIKEIEALHSRFEDSSLGARLQQYVGQGSWDREEKPDLKPIAEELYANPALFAQHWPWLTSGDAAMAWELGEILATVDSGGKLAELLPSFPDGGYDHRLLCAYVRVRRQVLGDDWYDSWVKSRLEQDEKNVPLLFEIAYRCGATEFIAKKLAETVHTKEVSPQIVGQLEFGRWGETLPIDVLKRVLQAMVETGHSETAIVILEGRLRTMPAEAADWEPLALQLVISSDVIRSKRRASFYWKEVAVKLVANHAGEIASAIFREHANRKSGIWFAGHSEAARILQACVERAPNEVWEALQPHLSTPAGAHMFSIGFPDGVLERIPSDVMAAWIAEQPEERAVSTVRLASTNVSSDDTPASWLIEEYGDNKRVANAFFAEYISGSWVGPSSAHWNQLADELQAVAARTSLPKLRRWATDSVRSLRSMAERDSQREEEEDLRSR